MRSHLNVCRKYRNQERDEAYAGDLAKARDEHADSAQDFATAADLDEQSMRGQPRRNDPHVKGGMQKMIAACGDKEEGEQRQRDAPPRACYLI